MYTLKELYETSNTEAEINGKWVPSRPINWQHRTLWRRIKESWAVFKGRADAFTWPEGQ